MFLNSLIIRQAKTKKITTVTVLISTDSDDVSSAYTTFCFDWENISNLSGQIYTVVLRQLSHAVELKIYLYCPYFNINVLSLNDFSRMFLSYCLWRHSAVE